MSSGLHATKHAKQQKALVEGYLELSLKSVLERKHLYPVATAGWNPKVHTNTSNLCTTTGNV